MHGLNILGAHCTLSLSAPQWDSLPVTHLVTLGHRLPGSLLHSPP